MPRTSSPPDAISMKLSSAPRPLMAASTAATMACSGSPGFSTSTKAAQPASTTLAARRIRAISQSLLTSRTSSMRPLAETISVPGSAWTKLAHQDLGQQFVVGDAEARRTGLLERLRQG